MIKTPRSSLSAFSDKFSDKSETGIDIGAMSLEKINKMYKSILTKPYDEEILFRPILAEKIMPKKAIPSMYANKRYIMITNKRLYTLDPKRLEKGEIDKDKLVVNVIDIIYLNHLIFFPKESFDAYECLYQQWDLKKLGKNFD